MVPEEVRILIDWRTLPLGREHSTVEGLQQFLQTELEDLLRQTPNLRLTVQETYTRQRAYTGWERTMPISTHGFLMAESHPVVNAAVQAVWEITGQTPKARPWTFGTDGGFPCAVHGIPTIGYAPGNENYSHTNRERLDLESARTAYEVYPVLARQLQQALESDSLVQSQAVGSKDHLFLKRLKCQ